MAKKKEAERSSAAKSKTQRAESPKTMAVPKQKRSIETRLKILKVGGELILKKGYHNITADEIAKAAGVSTGIVYHYFRDKKDILITALDMTAEHLISDVAKFYHEAESSQDEMDFDAFAEKTMDYILEYHRRNWEVHEEMEALYHTDAEIAAVSDTFWQKMYATFEEILLTKGAKKEHLSENIRMAMNYFECYCHTYMHPINDALDQDYMRKKTIETIKKLIFGE
ncbi:MAG: TetR/AcrR family transcriptional regulator [Clostridiales bacterium]|nr:TetR/AcrR family transcriptional regulator [Clostridiales bacterium]